MKQNILVLRPLAGFGSGNAQILENKVSVCTKGINGVLKAWLIGGEAECLGNLVGGKLEKEIDTAKHNGILITQSGRQMLIGFYGEDASLTTPPFNIAGYTWEKICTKNFSSRCETVKYILSNRLIYDSFKKHGHYYFGSGKSGYALAVPCANGEKNPLNFLGNSSKLSCGYSIVCIDDKAHRIFPPKSA